MQRAVRKGVFAGCADTVIHKGEVIFKHCFGYADLEQKTRFSHDSICRIYCSTKPYTLFIAKMLEEEGLLNPEAPVKDYIPAMRVMRVQRDSAKSPQLAKRTMRIKHLMTHSAGFSYQADFGFPPDDTQKRYSRIVSQIEQGRVKSLADWVNRLAKVPLCFEPGERYEYGHSIDVLGRILEIVTRQDLATLMQNKLFGPLGMKDTAFHVPDSKLAHLSAIYGAAPTWGYLYGSNARKRPVSSKRGLLRIDGGHARESAWAQRQVSGYYKLG
jgi:CubicO group peptidase (beta-lactamase class C family)